MNNAKKGFTLVEVALFLALSGILVAGVISGTNRSLARQRYNNSVETFKDFISNIYSQVLYTQTTRPEPGRSEQAIYGKLITFGENEDPTVHTYTVVGKVLSSKDISNIGHLTTIEALDYVGVTLYDDSGELIDEKTYDPKWGTSIEHDSDIESSDKKLELAVLIARSPVSGAISTYVSPEMINPHGGTEIKLKKYLPSWNGYEERDPELEFKPKEINFCLNSEDKWAAGNFRRNIRINKNAHNSSAMEIINDDDEGNKCAE